MDNKLILLRQNQIRSFIKTRGIASIKDISDALKISQSTIRRDLSALERRGKISSFHGGVTVNSNYETFKERLQRNSEEKIKIGRKAAYTVQNGDMIYIGGGSTTFEMARALSERIDLEDVCIVSSAINIASCFDRNKYFKVIVPGGIFKVYDESMTSKMTIDVLSKFNFNKAYLGVQGLTAKEGYTMPGFELNNMKQVIIGKSKQVFLLCDNTKFGIIGPYSTAKIEEIDTVVTNMPDSDNDEIERIGKMGPKIIFV